MLISADLFHGCHAQDSHGQGPAKDSGTSDAPEREDQGQAIDDQRRCVLASHHLVSGMSSGIDELYLYIGGYCTYNLDLTPHLVHLTATRTLRVCDELQN